MGPALTIPRTELSVGQSQFWFALSRFSILFTGDLPMKRWMLRLSALSGIVVLGLIAIAQAQRNAPPDNSDDTTTSASAERDPFAIRPERAAARQNASEPRRFAGDAAAQSIPAEDRPVKRLRNVVREASTTGDSSPPELDRAAPTNDPFNVRETAQGRIAALPRREGGFRTAER